MLELGHWFIYLFLLSGVQFKKKRKKKAKKKAGERERSFICVLVPTHDLTRCNICPGVRSPREDISWTLIWD